MKKTWAAMAVMALLAVVAIGCRSAATATPDALDPAAIEAGIRAQVLGAYPDETFDIGVSVTADGVVTLSGDVDSAEQKRRIGQLAASVDGVRRVNNELRVE
jgi:osmotically-inducible protein OsmY